jgi:hypothetical protein
LPRVVGVRLDAQPRSLANIRAKQPRIRARLGQSATIASAMAFVWLSLAAAAAGIAWGVLVDPRGLYGCAFVLAALAYYGAIRWVDQHDRWS